MTSTAADSAIDISSRALILIGAEPITSFTDGTTESLVAGSLYEDICRSALSNTRWRFATDQAVLNRLTDAPTGRYDFAYQLPPDTLLVHAVTVNDGQIEYQIYGDMVYADTSTQDEVIADFTFRAREDYAAASCAIQNFMLSAYGYGFGTKWSTGTLTRLDSTYKIAEVNPDTHEIIGFIWVGEAVRVPSIERPDINEHKTVLN